MGTQRLGAFPSLHNKMAIDSVCYSIGYFFIKMFPVDFFKHVYIDTQTGIANSYIIEKGEMVPFESGKKIDRPRLVIEAKMTGNNVEDTQFGSLRNVYQQPGAYAIEPTLRGYQTFYRDPYGVEIRTNDIFKKVDITVSIEVTNKGDQEALINILDTNIKKLYGYQFDIDVNYNIPTYMLAYLRNCIFKKEFDQLKQNEKILTPQQKTDTEKYINDQFIDHLLKYGYGDIKLYNVGTDEKPKNITVLNRSQTVYLKLENFEPDDGTKKGASFEYFKMVASGYFNFYNLVTFITKLPAIIRGSKNDKQLYTSVAKNYANNLGTMEFREEYYETRNKYNFKNDYWVSMYFEKELIMEQKTETFNIIDFMPEAFVNKYMIRDICNFLTEKDYRDFLFVIVNRNDDLLSEDNYSWDKDLNITINDCDLNALYYVEVFFYKPLYEQMYDIVSKTYNQIIEDEDTEDNG